MRTSGFVLGLPTGYDSIFGVVGHKTFTTTRLGVPYKNYFNVPKVLLL